jgi:hypothetical protein
MKALPVYIGYVNDADRYRLIACRSKYKAVKRLGVSMKTFENFFGLADNPDDIALAQANPGVAFECEVSYNNRQWKPMNDANTRPPSFVSCVEQRELRELDAEETRAFVLYHALEKHPEAVEQELIDQFPLLQIISNRLNLTGKDWKEIANPVAVCFLVDICKGNPGKAVMWAYTLKDMYLREKAQVTLTTISMPQYFGWGIPTDEGFERVWDAQKKKRIAPLDTDNRLDMREVWILP